MSSQVAILHCVLTSRKYGGSPVKVGEEEFSLFRDSEYGGPELLWYFEAYMQNRILAKINES